MLPHRIEAEQDLEWRIDELNYYGNLLNNAEEVHKNNLYRMIITMFYAHYEGYMYFLFSLYVRHINDERVHCRSVKPAIAAASLATVLHELRNTSRIPRQIAGTLYAQDILQVARDAEFIESLDNYLNKIVVIPDKAISTDSNLKMGVLKPILYRLGFQEDDLDRLSYDITTLVNYRNTIAHGSRTKPISKQEYDKIRQKTLELMIQVRDHIIQNIESRGYMKSNSV